MSRISKNPVHVTDNVKVTINSTLVTVKGPLGELKSHVTPNIKIEESDNTLRVLVAEDTKQARAMSGTMRSILFNMVNGVTIGFQKKLMLVGVGYRANTDGQNLNLSLGFSHPVVHKIPLGIKIETPVQTEILIKGIDKQQVGQVAAEIRSYRKPEPYKGKGVRYSDEVIILKEARKK